MLAMLTASTTGSEPRAGVQEAGCRIPDADRALEMAMLLQGASRKRKSPRDGGLFSFFTLYIQDTKLEELVCQICLLDLAWIFPGINADYFRAEARDLTRK